MHTLPLPAGHWWSGEELSNCLAGWAGRAFVAFV